MLKFVIFSILGLSKAFNMGLPTDYDDQEMMYKRSPAEMEDFMKLLSVILGLTKEFFKSSKREKVFKIFTTIKKLKFSILIILGYTHKLAPNSILFSRHRERTP